MTKVAPQTSSVKRDAIARASGEWASNGVGTTIAARG